MTSRPRQKQRTANKGFAIAGVPCFADTFVQGENSVLRMKFTAKTPRHRKPPKRCKQPLTNRTCKMKENIKIFGSYKLRVNSDILLPKKKAKHKEESKSRKRKNSKV